jgi:hypothetical protein
MLMRSARAGLGRLGPSLRDTTEIVTKTAITRSSLARCLFR